MITSRDNETLKLVGKLLAGPKHRRETGLFAVEGDDLVAAADAAGIEPVHRLVDGENVAEGLLGRISTLAHPPRAIGVYRLSDLPRGTRDWCLALWRVADPGNVGTLLRTADAFGASISLSEGCADPCSPKAVRASAGAIFRVPAVAWGELPEPRFALVAHDGAPLVGAAFGTGGTLLLGSERHGLPEDIATGCYKLTIDLPGAAESLNVAAAGAIALYEASRRR
jgi:TrmH family RNA methyltransferase